MGTAAVREKPVPRERAEKTAVVSIEDAYLNLRQLQKYSGLSERTLLNLRKHPTHPMPYYKVGGKVLVRRSEFDAWVQQFRAASPADVDAVLDDLLRGV